MGAAQRLTELQATSQDAITIMQGMSRVIKEQAAEVARLRAALIQARADLMYEGWSGSSPSDDDFREMARAELAAEGLLPPA